MRDEEVLALVDKEPGGHDGCGSWAGLLRPYRRESRCLVASDDVSVRHLKRQERQGIVHDRPGEH